MKSTCYRSFQLITGIIIALIIASVQIITQDLLKLLKCLNKAIRFTKKKGERLLQTDTETLPITLTCSPLLQILEESSKLFRYQYATLLSATEQVALVSKCL